MSAGAPLAITELRTAAAFAETVSDRIWRAWWQEDGFPLSHIADRVAASLTTTGLPLSLVAHRGGRFLGTASLIPSDLDARPQLSPWVAAVWVEPDHRNTGIGTALVQAAADLAFARGFGPVYLCATPANSGFYQRIGWTLIESGVGGLNVFRRAP
ncbi:MAG: GNAT family N-acetyltransferase [Rhodobacteraceae bacterium]|nr:GNAT family N-acetyltransferase [Paracoccaceae bacterium]